MNDADKSNVEPLAQELLREFQGVLSWRWDGRFETVLAEFGIDSRESRSHNPGATSQYDMGRLKYCHRT